MEESEPQMSRVELVEGDVKLDDVLPHGVVVVVDDGAFVRCRLFNRNTRNDAVLKQQKQMNKNKTVTKSGT